MAKSYKATCDGFDMGVFRPIRFEDGAVGYQGADPATGELLGILWGDGRYDEAGRNGNTTWELCEETESHRRLLRLASQPWESAPMEFVPVS
jgi:hypothetical protein